MKLFTTIQKVHWTIYTLGYLIKVFVQWRFSNPFQWVVDLPTMTSDQRAEGLLAVFTYFVTVIPISVSINQALKEREQKKIQPKDQ